MLEHRTCPRSNPDYWMARRGRNVARVGFVDGAFVADGWRLPHSCEYEHCGVAATPFVATMRTLPRNPESQARGGNGHVAH